MSRPDPAKHPPTPRRRVRRRFWLALVLAMLVSLPSYPPAWHAALRTWLGWQARHQGYNFSVASIQGGVFDTTQLYGLRWRQRDPLSPDGAAGTDLSIARADLTLAWTVPWFQRAAPSWVQELVLDGVRGQWDLSKRAIPGPPATSLAVPSVANHGFTPASIQGNGFVRVLGSVFPSMGRFSEQLVPETFLIRADDLRMHRGRYQLHAVHLRLSGSRDDAGQFFAREVNIAGPGFENTLHQPHARTFWKGSRLTLTQLPLGPDVTLVSATLDGSRLRRHRIDWEGRLTALGGEVRGQGWVNFARERLAVEVAASLQGAAVRPLVRLLGIDGPADGLIDQGNFTFRGDPENLPAAQMSLAAHSTDFRWGKRRWEDLALQAVVVNRRVQVHRLELRQSRNRVSLTGECPLPLVPADEVTAADALRQWREGGFSCQVDARLDDLRSLADLFEPHAPELDGRMSVNGALGAPAGPGQGVNGYLNVEGTRLTLRGAPLDYLRSTLLFKDGGLRVADLQATHGYDYFTGTGSLRLDGPPRYEGELRAEVRRLAAYTPALAGLPLADGLARVNSLSALLRWDDSLLRFEQFHGKVDDAPFMVGGTMDLHDAEHPVLDLAFDAEGMWLPGSLQADCVLTVRGELGETLQLGGDVRLRGGEISERFCLNRRKGAISDSFLPLGQWLPEGGTGWMLDLQVTAAAPFRLGFVMRGSWTDETDLAGEFFPDLRVITRDADANPEITGRIELRDVTTLPYGQGPKFHGALFFTGDADPEPGSSVLVDLTSTNAETADQLWLYGPSSRLRTWPLGGFDPVDFQLTGEVITPMTPPTTTLAPALADEIKLWIESPPAPAPEPVEEFELILRRP